MFILEAHTVLKIVVLLDLIGKIIEHCPTHNVEQNERRSTIHESADLYWSLTKLWFHDQPIQGLEVTGKMGLKMKKKQKKKKKKNTKKKTDFKLHVYNILSLCFLDICFLHTLTKT